jgi:cytochrome c-type biogenesis protein CcmH
LPLFAVEDYYPFSLPKDQERFQTLTSELRCLVCQNENLAESNAKLAIDLRNQIYQQIKIGKSNQAIIHYLVTRYGDYILYRPPFNFSTLLLWIAPFLVLFFGMIYLIYYLRYITKNNDN